MTRALIFDFDGVICQTETFKLDQLAAYYKDLGLFADPRRLYLLAGGTFMEKEAILDRIFDGQPRYQEVKELVMNYKGTPFPYKKLLTPGIADTLEAVKGEQIPMAVASNSQRKRLRTALGECGILPYFTYTESAFDLGKRKPDPLVYTYTMKKFGAAPEDCVIVEDSALGIKAGKAAGALVVALRDRDEAIDQSEADVIITRIEDILGCL